MRTRLTTGFIVLIEHFGEVGVPARDRHGDVVVWGSIYALYFEPSQYSNAVEKLRRR